MKKFYFFLTNKNIPLLQKIYKDKEFQIKNTHLNDLISQNIEEGSELEGNQKENNKNNFISNLNSKNSKQSHFAQKNNQSIIKESMVINI